MLLSVPLVQVYSRVVIALYSWIIEARFSAIKLFLWLVLKASAKLIPDPRKYCGALG